MLKKVYERDKEHFNCGTLGHIDHGKTTLTAAICNYLSLIDPENNTAKKYEEIDKAPEEKKRGITINATAVEYYTNKYHVGHVDCPGHADYVKNMVTGATQLDGAILVISLKEGIMKQTKEHLLLASKLGLKKIILFWNKADLGYDEEDLELNDLELENMLSEKGMHTDYPRIKGSALAAANAISADDPAFGPIKEIIDAIDTYFDAPKRDLDSPALMPIESVLSISGRGTVLTGKVEKGVFSTNQVVELIGLPKTTKKNQNIVCKEIQTFFKVTPSAVAGDNVGILVSGIEKDELDRGQVLCAKGAYSAHTKVKAMMYILKTDEGGRKKPFRTNYEPQFFIRTADVTGKIILDQSIQNVFPGDNIEAEIELQKPVCLSEKTTFTIREGGLTIGAGVVTEVIV